jgi:hypothetical protein
VNINTYQDLIALAEEQPEPQRLLFVFSKAELPEDATPAQKKAFEQGEGGVLNPVICVDRTPEEVRDFTTLVSESEQTGHDWDIAFVAAMSGRGGMPPTSEECLQPLKMMMQQIQSGMISRFLAFSRQGELVQLN